MRKSFELPPETEQETRQEIIRIICIHTGYTLDKMIEV
jgi:hypothetical protein